MKRYLKGALILFGVVFFGLLRLPAMIEGFIASLFSNNGKYSLLNDDRAIASRVYGTSLRTVSGICGANAKKKKTGYVVAANVIDFLAVLVGDKPKHCERADDWEIQRGFDK